MKVTHRVLGLLAAGLVGLTSQAQAQDANFAGSTQGCFYASGSAVCTPGSSSNLLLLSYVNSTFNVTSYGGYAALGTSPSSPNFNNLGSFSLGSNGTVQNYNGATFLLNVIFTSPTIVSPTSYFTASLQGSVVSLANGGVGISFSPSNQIFTYDAGGGLTNTFTLSVNNVSITPANSPVPLTGSINVTATPEPATTALLATGLFGLVPMFRRRRKDAV